MAAFNDPGKHLFPACLCGDKFNVNARNHYFLYGSVRKLHYSLDHLLPVRFKGLVDFSAYLPVSFG